MKIFLIILASLLGFALLCFFVFLLLIKPSAKKREVMARYKGVKFVLISPEELALPSFIQKEYIEDKGIEFKRSASLDEVMGELDILYMTRVQRERFFNEEDYLRLKDTYILTADKMKLAKKDMIVMHPLPRVNEISTAVDADPRACYFRQAYYGKFIRMALIMKLLGVTK